ncbi:hypothetical protein ACHAQA_002357 [Verticillium albo-atrum]
MSSTTNVFITGVGRGLGRGFLTAYLARPNHTVIGSVRDVSSKAAKELQAITPAAGSRLLLVKIESESTTDAAEAVRQIQAEGIEKLDLVIANSGITGTQGPIETVDLDDFKEVMLVNTVGPLALFIATRPLLAKAENPKWVSISTLMATIGALEGLAAYPGLSYSTSKVALNFITKSIHVWHTNITALSVHPGLVGTDMGISGAKFHNFPEEAIVSIESSVKDVIKLADNATRADHSGKFLNPDGSIIPW